MKALYRICFGCIWYVTVVLLNHVWFFCDLRDSSSGWHFCVWLVCDSHQPSLSMGFSKKNTGGDFHFLHHGFFPTEGMNSSPLHWQADSLLLSYQESPCSWSTGEKRTEVLSPLPTFLFTKSEKESTMKFIQDLWHPMTALQVKSLTTSWSTEFRMKKSRT